MVEGGRLEIVLAVMSRYVGSNPTFSAIFDNIVAPVVIVREGDFLCRLGRPPRRFNIRVKS